MLPANFLSEPASYHCLLFYPHILLWNYIFKNTNLPVYKQVRAVMAGSGEKLALSMVIVPRKSEAPSLMCSRDMATPPSLNYREQSYPEGIHQLRSQIRRICCRSTTARPYSVWNWHGMGFCTSCQAAKPHGSRIASCSWAPPLALPRQRKTTNMHLRGWRRMLGLVNLLLLLLLYGYDCHNCILHTPALVTDSRVVSQKP